MKWLVRAEFPSLENFNLGYNQIGGSSIRQISNVRWGLKDFGLKNSLASDISLLWIAGASFPLEQLTIG